ncbi:protein phosphatase 2C-like domain-containing protein 1 [Gastrophryne carolinensis]
MVVTYFAVFDFKMIKTVLPPIEEMPSADVQSRDDPEDHRSHISDTWFTCIICQEHIDPHHILKHKQFHKANTVLGYKKGEGPSDILSLVNKRKHKISQIKRSSRFTHSEGHKIDHAYEQLKGQLLSLTPNINRMNLPSDDSCQVHTLDIHSDLVRAIVTCSDRNASWQSDMEDLFAVLNNFGQREDSCFVGIFDGCHGKSAAISATREFPILFLDHLSKVDPSYKLNEDERHFVSSLNTVFKENYKETEDKYMTDERKTSKDADIIDIHAAYAKAFWRMDRMLQLGRGETSRSRWSGCTAVTCLLHGINSEETEATHKATQTCKRRLGMMHIANIGGLWEVLSDREVAALVQDLLEGSSFDRKPKDTDSQSNFDEHHKLDIHVSKNEYLKSQDLVWDDEEDRSKPESGSSALDCETKAETSEKPMANTNGGYQETAAYVCQQIVNTAFNYKRVYLLHKDK